MYKKCAGKGVVHKRAPMFVKSIGRRARNRHSTAQHSTAHRQQQDNDRTGQVRTTRQDRRGQDRTGQETTGQERTGQTPPFTFDFQVSSTSSSLVCRSLSNPIHPIFTDITE